MHSTTRSLATLLTAHTQRAGLAGVAGIRRLGRTRQPDPLHGSQRIQHLLDATAHGFGHANAPGALPWRYALSYRKLRASAGHDPPPLELKGYKTLIPR